MRRFIAILLAISLSWVTTGYACQMESLAALDEACHCPHEHADADPAADAGQLEDCCQPVLSTAVDQQQPALTAAAAALDLPSFSAISRWVWPPASPGVRRLARSPPALGPPRTGSRTYLATARLRI